MRKFYCLFMRLARQANYLIPFLSVDYKYRVARRRQRWYPSYIDSKYQYAPITIQNNYQMQMSTYTPSTLKNVNRFKLCLATMMVALVALLLSPNSFSQTTTLIDPTGDGG